MTTPFNRVKFTPVAGGTGSFVVSAAVTGYNTPAQRGVPTGTVVSYTAESSDKTEWETGIGTYTSGTVTLARTSIRENSNGDTSAVDFAAVPSVWVDWHAQELSNYVAPVDGEISLTAGASPGGLTTAGGITLTTGSAVGAEGVGGPVQITGGDGGLVGGWPVAFGDGGSFTFTGGYSIGGVGGNFFVDCGHGHYGGEFRVIAGNSENEGHGGDVSLRAGDGVEDGGVMSLQTGACTETGPGGEITIQTGAGGPTATGGPGGGISIQMGSGRAGNSEGGYCFVECGNGFGSGEGGSFFLEAGNSGATGIGGSFSLTTGNGGATSGAAGDITFSYGTAAGSGRDGLFFPNLPTANPGVSGAMWNDGGTVKIA